MIHLKRCEWKNFFEIILCSTRLVFFAILYGILNEKLANRDENSFFFLRNLKNRHGFVGYTLQSAHKKTKDLE